MRTAIVSTYPPRACGIGTFAADVRSALPRRRGDRPRRDPRCRQLPDPARSGRGSPRPSRRRTVDDVRAARILGRLDVDIVLLQHEYGIFGGARRCHVLRSPEELSQPLVVTLHTVLSEPTPHQAHVLAGTLPPGRTRDRDDRDRQAPARGQPRRARRARFVSCPTERQRCSRDAPMRTRSNELRRTTPRTGSCSRPSG